MKITGAVLTHIGAERPYASSKPLVVREIELDEPGPGEVRLRIEAAGLCHSDLSVVNGTRPRPMPMLLGHEAAGIVEALGPGVDDLEVGDRVVTVFLPRCEKCANCLTGGKLPCTPGSETNGAGTLPSGARRLHEEDGAEIHHHLGVSGFATHAVVDRRSVVRVGSDVPPTVAAVLGCAVLTGGGAVRNAGGLMAGQDLIVVGLGGVGMSAVLAGRAITHGAGGRVIGIDSNTDKHATALALGADAVYTPQEAADLGITAPVVVEAAGHPRAFETAFHATAPGGTTVTAGLPAPGALSQIPPLTVTAEARTIIGSYLGSAIPARDIPAFEALWRDGSLPAEKLITSTITLDELNEALDILDSGDAIRQMIVF